MSFEVIATHRFRRDIKKLAKKYTSLKAEFFVLSRADINTGIVLDENLLYATDLSQIVYTIYPDLETAIEAAKFIVKSKPTIECYIHNKDNVLLGFFDCNTKM